jgi:hypothetical protein
VLEGADVPEDMEPGFDAPIVSEPVVTEPVKTEWPSVHEPFPDAKPVEVTPKP